MSEEIQLTEAERAGPEYLLWTRMQTEAGQSLKRILDRKERERAAGNGRFFWGVGNAPARIIRDLARTNTPIDVTFSKMLSKPKLVDQQPESIVVWRRYIDCEGRLRDLPQHALVTSRGESALSKKRAHYALECFSTKPLKIANDPDPFDPSMFRNASGKGAPIGASQVTSLLVPSTESARRKSSSYLVDMKARLTGSYWVKLVDPAPVCRSSVDLIDEASTKLEDWLLLLKQLKETEADEGKTRDLLSLNL